jgi:SPP1 family predicted phage head-tail adaptor
MFDSVIKLISESKVVDEYGDLESKETERSVFAELRSVGQSEFYQAQALGLKPEIKFVLSDYLEYQGEQKLRFQGFGETEEKEYAVLRTFRNGNTLELVCKRGID